MSGVLFLIPVSLALGLTGLAAFFWSMRHNQFEDLDGDAERILIAPDIPTTPTMKERNNGQLASKPHHPDPERRL